MRPHGLGMGRLSRFRGFAPPRVIRMSRTSWNFGAVQPSEEWSALRRNHRSVRRLAGAGGPSGGDVDGPDGTAAGGPLAGLGAAHGRQRPDRRAHRSALADPWRPTAGVLDRSGRRGGRRSRGCHASAPPTSCCRTSVPGPVMWPARPGDVRQWVREHRPTNLHKSERQGAGRL
jgi:hypothetical protein